MSNYKEGIREQMEEQTDRTKQHKKGKQQNDRRGETVKYTEEKD